MASEKETLKVQVRKVNRILDNNDDLNTQKESISMLMKEVEFLLGGQEEKCMEYFSDLIIAMANFDFTKRVKVDESSSALTIFVASALNMLCEEYQHTALQRSVMKSVLYTLVTDIDLLILTDTKGKITMLSQQGNKLSKIDDKILCDYGINVLFENFEIVDITLKEGDCKKDIPVQLKWKGEFFPASLSLSISSNMGKVEAMIYTVRLLS